MFLYRDILSQAWKNTWRHKYLWFFGLFAALLGGWGDLEIVFRGTNGDQGLPYGFQLLSAIFLNGNIFHNISQISSNSYLSLFMSLLVLLIILALSLFLFWLTIISQSALVNNTTRIITGKKHDFASGLHSGINKFWPVAGLNLLLKIIIYGIFSLFGLYLLNGAEDMLSAAYQIAAFMVFIPLAVILSFITKYAICYIVIKNEKFLDSLRLSWRLFLKNWLVSLEMAFMLFFITFLFALGLLLLFLILSIPFLFVVIVLSRFALIFNLWLIVAAGLILLLFVIIASGAILAAFQISAWTGLFLDLISRGGESKIMRLFGK
ncbi:MAG: hypothetical protein V1867_01120 [Candidatus Falkowbacteria bacterium]